MKKERNEKKYYYNGYISENELKHGWTSIQITL